MPTRTAAPDGHAARPPAPVPDEVALDETAVLLVAGLQAREREIQRAVVAPFARDVERTYRLIERGMQLPEGAIGTTHELVDGAPPRLRRLPQRPAPTSTDAG